MTQPTVEPPLGGYAVSLTEPASLTERAAELVDTGLLCGRCGTPMPPMPAELAKVAATQTVTLNHERCPGEPEPAPVGRYFEVRVKIVEVTEETDMFDTTHPVATEMLSFISGVRAANLEASLRPLAAALGEKWLEAEKHARLADSNLPPVATGPEPTS